MRCCIRFRSENIEEAVQIAEVANGEIGAYSCRSSPILGELCYTPDTPYSSTAIIQIQEESRSLIERYLQGDPNIYSLEFLPDDEN